MNQTGVRGTGFRKQARRNVDSPVFDSSVFDVTC
jgi:hypothetical protein